MIARLKKIGLAAGVAAMVAGTATSAQARDRWDHRGGGNDAAIAIGAGLVGLAIGAAIADRDDRRYYDRRYYPSRRYVRVRGYPGYYYYYDGYPNRYYRDRYYSRYYQPYYRDRYRSRWDRGYGRVDRMYRGDRYDRRDYRHDRRDWRR
ncbi:hypothetical protein B2G71_10200 [Novosphingobium sp. PC22D]|uniref:hypothetical protein n=1 Tax=Novosphingobium sp. PC22D TaxID=1962403 RepID=UPI000BF0C0FF|nr:hypothetical protein [Novosphingobium sp. PC22D]PEQ12671.1 hypothetical protein B2G71_10200 [Novosphingobium sp. PC22D]